jgi:hypothetical protein
MNEHPLPLRPDQIDELLNAELDGEFDAAASDFGLEPARARELLADAGTEARRAALSRARDALSETPELDELMAARLRDKAMKAGAHARTELDIVGRQRRLRRLTLASGALAAMVAVVVGIAALADNNGSESKKSSAGVATANRPPVAHASGLPTTALYEAGPSTAAPPVPSSAPVLALGPMADAGALQRKLESLDFASGAYARASGDQVAEKAAVSCDAEAKRLTGLTAAPVARARATLAGTPVTVLVFTTIKGHLVLVLRDDCTLVTQLTLP